MRGDDGLGEVGDGDVGRPLVHVRHGAAVELHVDEEVVDAGGEERRDEAHDPQRGLGLLGGCIRSLNLHYQFYLTFTRSIRYKGHLNMEQLDKIKKYGEQFIKDAIHTRSYVDSTV